MRDSDNTKTGDEGIWQEVESETEPNISHTRLGGEQPNNEFIADQAFFFGKFLLFLLIMFGRKEINCGLLAASEFGDLYKVNKAGPSISSIASSSIGLINWRETTKYLCGAQPSWQG